MNSICIFLGSNPGADPVYARAAQDMGKELAARGLGRRIHGLRISHVHGGAGRLDPAVARDRLGRGLGRAVPSVRGRPF